MSNNARIMVNGAASAPSGGYAIGDFGNNAANSPIAGQGFTSVTVGANGAVSFVR
jgi:hypothetical protein